MRPLKFPVVVYLVLLFFSGVVVGALAYRLYSPRPVRSSEFRQKYVDEMRSRLKLNGEQVIRLEEILNATESRYREVRERMKPEMTAIQQEHVGKVRAILNEVQQAEYEKMREERERHRRNKKHKF